MGDESLKDFILDQLGSEQGVTAKRMFSGYGFYHDSHFFGILIKGSFYLLTDSESRARFIERGMPPFTYEKEQRVVSMNYYEVPAEVLEARDQFLEWTRDAIRISRARSDERATGSKRSKLPKSRTFRKGATGWTKSRDAK